MNKDFIVLLLQKDIKELEMLTTGFANMDVFPEAILHLAKTKAENIIRSLNELNSHDESVHINSVTSACSDEKNPEDSLVEAFIAELNDANYFSDSYDELVDSESDTQMMSESNPETLNIGEKSSVYENSLIENVIEDDEEIEKNDFSTQKEDIDVAEKLSDSVEETVEQSAEFVEDNSCETSEKKITDILNSAEKEERRQQVSAGNKSSNGQKITPKVLNDLSVNANSLESSLSNQRIADIRDAISISERFLFQRQLFGDSGEILNKTIIYLNQLANFEDAEDFLRSKFKWSDDNPYAEQFLQIVKRRYL